MIYANNILPSDASRYTFDKASMVNGQLIIQAGGSVSYEIVETVLGELTEYFRVSLLPNVSIDRYKPTLYVKVHAKLADGNEYYYTLTPTVDKDSIYTDEIHLQAGEYEEFTYVITSEQDVIVQLWELCPEATDANIDVIIDGVKQSLPRLLYDYNMMPLVVSTEESIVGLITFNLLDATDLQGHLEISYVSSSDCVLTIRIKDIDTTELYTPIVYDIKAGRGNIALPHSYLNRPKGLHNTYVTAQVSTGTFTIETRGLLYTIDGGYLAERLIDAGMTVLDISIKHLAGSKEPNELWAIGIDANECFVKSRPYDTSANEGFVPQYSLGYAKLAALEFNGVWTIDMSIDALQHTIITEEEPYAFWTDADDTLYCQKGTDETTRFILDEKVTCVSACRGFASTIYPTQDQGLIVLYVKEGVLFYRNYCRTTDNKYVWQGPFTIELDEEVISAYVHRLNDYRVGFAINTTTHNYWYISDRTYVNQAAPTELLNMSVVRSYPSIAVIDPKEPYVGLTCEGALEQGGMSAILTFNRPIKSIDPIEKQWFVSTAGVKDVIIVDDYHIRVLFNKSGDKGTTITHYAYSYNVQYSPQDSKWTPMPYFVVTIPAANVTERLDLSIVKASAKLYTRGIETIKHDQPNTETLNCTLNAASARLAVTPIETITVPTQPGDTLSLELIAAGSSMVLTQTGVSPI